MNDDFAARIKNLNPSPTFAVDAKAKKMKKQGIPVINLGLGEPDFSTPMHIKKAAIKAINEDFTHYTQAEGILPLREAIARKLQKDNNLNYDPSEIIVGSGAKPLLYSAFQVLCDYGDEVIVPVPTWGTYLEQIKLAGGKPILIKLESPFQLKAVDIQKAITKKTKIILLNSPSNPTGAMIEESEVKKIADLAIKSKIYVVSDEIYEKIVYDNKNISIASLNKQIRDLTITINGVSKAYAMTGWRIGYAAGRREIITAMTSLQGQMTSNASSISQMAAIEALNSNQKPVEDMRNEFAKRREYLISALSEIKGIKFVPPQGSFYFFVSVEKLLNKMYPTSSEWCEGFLEKEKVAVVPGEAFRYPGYIRISFAASLEELVKALKALKRFVE